MTAKTQDVRTTEIEFRRRTIDAGEARCAVFRRTYEAPIDDVWDACTSPERLARWYAPVQGDLRPGGEFSQGNFGSGRVVRCEQPSRLTVALGGGDTWPDQLQLVLEATAEGTTVLEFEHATTLDTHEIGGQIFDAVYCMGGGYGPRLLTLDQHLRGELPDLDPSLLHLREEYRPAINDAMARLDTLIQADKRSR